VVEVVVHVRSDRGPRAPDADARGELELQVAAQVDPGEAARGFLLRETLRSRAFFGGVPVPDRFVALVQPPLPGGLAQVVLPYLEELGARWQRGDASIAQEHFASSVLQGRLLGLARGWGLGLGPVAVLACLPGEQHELGLAAFGLALRARGWRIGYFGGNTPLDTVAKAADSLEAQLVVLSTISDERVRAVGPELRSLAERHRIAIGGAGATGDAAEEVGAIALTGDLLAEAGRVTALVQSSRS
jgi:methanogenic corrinoid protein MtbC1